MRKPKGYKPAPDDEWIALKDLRPEHVGRVFEARDQRTGAGILGYLQDANHYLLDGTVSIRFTGQQLGIFAVPDALILLKPEGFTYPGLGDPPPRYAAPEIDIPATPEPASSAPTDEPCSTCDGRGCPECLPTEDSDQCEGDCDSMFCTARGTASSHALPADGGPE